MNLKPVSPEVDDAVYALRASGAVERTGYDAYRVADAIQAWHDVKPLNLATLAALSLHEAATDIHTACTYEPGSDRARFYCGHLPEAAVEQGRES